MNDFRDLAERRIVCTESFHERFEGAPIALVSEVRLGHVEAQLAQGRGLTGAHEAELGLTVDEALNEPRAGDPVDQNTPARHPRATVIGRRTGRRHWGWSRRFTRLQDRDCSH